MKRDPKLDADLEAYAREIRQDSVRPASEREATARASETYASKLRRHHAEDDRKRKISTPYDLGGQITDTGSHIIYTLSDAEAAKIAFARAKEEEARLAEALARAEDAKLVAEAKAAKAWRQAIIDHVVKGVALVICLAVLGLLWEVAVILSKLPR